MKLEDIKALNLKQFQHVEIRYTSETGDLETKCGWFVQLMEREIPPEYQSSYPIKPPFVEIAYKLDRNNTFRDTVQYVPDRIYLLRILNPTVEF